MEEWKQKLISVGLSVDTDFTLEKLVDPQVYILTKAGIFTLNINISN